MFQEGAKDRISMSKMAPGVWRGRCGSEVSCTSSVVMMAGVSNRVAERSESGPIESPASAENHNGKHLRL